MYPGDPCPGLPSPPLMERTAIFCSSLLCIGGALGQMVVPDGTSLTIDEGTSLRIDAPLAWTLQSGSQVVNNGDITLDASAQLDEALGAAISGMGTERITRTLSGPLTNENLGGLGGILTTGASLGSTHIVRGHTPFTDYSGHTSIARWIDFSPTNNTGLNATLSFSYDPAELNGLVEMEQRLHIRASADVWWYFTSTVDVGDHAVTSNGLDSLGVFTTFDEDLPNSIPGSGRGTSFALWGNAGGPMYLRVPAGAQAMMLDIHSANGMLVAALAPRWNEGVHVLPDIDLSPGVYQLRVNARDTFRFVHP